VLTATASPNETWRLIGPIQSCSFPKRRRSPRDGKRGYHANTPSPAVPDGLGDEEAIRAVWAGGAGGG
jgi:hypothetical protein